MATPVLEDLQAYLIDEHVPPDDGAAQADDVLAADDIVAAAVAHAIDAGLKSGRYIETGGMIVMAGGK